jgi:hypothetical protein
VLFVSVPYVWFSTCLYAAGESRKLKMDVLDADIK